MLKLESLVKLAFAKFANPERTPRLTHAKSNNGVTFL